MKKNQKEELQECSFVGLKKKKHAITGKKFQGTHLKARMKITCKNH